MARNPEDGLGTPTDGKKRMSPMFFIGMLLILVLLVLVAVQTVLLLFFGMLPTIVAYIVDRSPQKYATFCVGGMNFCGVFPFILDLWLGTYTLAAALDILTDVFSLAVMYGLAGFGWALYTAIPPVVVSVLTVITQRRIATLRTSQRRIIEEWGDEVAKTGDDEKKPPPKAAETEAA